MIIIGGGPAGLSMAAALADTKLEILVLDMQSELQLANPQYDGREIALTHLSEKIMQKLGMWEHIPEEGISVIKEAKVFNGDVTKSLNFSHLDTDKDKLGLMVSNHRIRKAAYELVKQHPNIHLVTEKQVLSLGTGEQQAWVELTDGERITAELIISADSRFSSTRRQMGIATSMLDFGRSCIVCTMSTEKSHHDTACEYFFYNRTIAILPLNNNQVSVVITIKSENAATLLNMDRKELALGIQTQINHQLGEMSFSSELYQYPLVATLAKRFYGQRYAVIGDAAVGMHPVTAHGYNLGLRGAHTLATEIIRSLRNQQSWHSDACLRRYESKHHRVCRPLFHGTNAIVTLYNKDHLAARFARDFLLKASAKIKPLKRLITNQLTSAKG